MDLMPAEVHAPVAIIGGGFSGTMVAAQLARLGIESIVVEGGGRAGLGTAFSTREPAHLLNVPAGNMSAWPDAPQDFADGEGGDTGRFAERRRFGRYLRLILDRAIESGRTALLEDRAVGASLEARSWTVELEQGGTVAADALVLAIGNQPPAQLPFARGAGDRMIDNPWGERARAAIEESARRELDVLILGTGLTMVDVVLSLDSAGHKGRILALSRRGLVPKSHESYEAVPAEIDELPGGNVRRLVDWLRKRSDAEGWRAAIDSLRPHSHALWQSLDLRQKQRFLRHARPWWDVHRHRIAPEVAQRLFELIGEGRLDVIAGRIAGIEGDGDGLDVTFRKRGQGENERKTRRFGYVFNCTGPLHEIGRTRDPLLRKLLDSGLAVSDELGLGLAVDERSRAQGGARLWALGALTKGRYWEMIAVPDIRDQAAQVAADIATELRQ
jgi:uncharacterized NAD(P)/FAD-binding protein YdhS